MLRHPLCISPLEEFTDNSFREVIGDAYAEANSVQKVLLCSGKLYYELLEEQQTNKRTDVAVIRLEQLHPFPHTQLDAELSKYSNAKVYWVQEEPSNMGYWAYVLRALRLKNILEDGIARKASSSPATGYNKVHNKQQREIIEKAFSI
jgi:2-oxoglutarate dehydrogenase E1 component